MRRAALEKPRTLRIWRRTLSRVGSRPSMPVAWQTQPGRFRKSRMRRDCGRRGGASGYGSKWHGAKRLEEQHADLLYRLMLEELGLDSLFHSVRCRHVPRPRTVSRA